MCGLAFYSRGAAGPWSKEVIGSTSTSRPRGTWRDTGRQGAGGLRVWVSFLLKGCSGTVVYRDYRVHQHQEAQRHLGSHGAAGGRRVDSVSSHQGCVCGLVFHTKG